MEKILTVIVPTYNMEKYLDRCLSSLIVSDKHMDMLEVLVVNDGSRDRSSEIAHRYESEYPGSFRVIDKTNGHYGSCVNRGLKEAAGKYVKVLDADDWFDTGNFDPYLDFLAGTGCDLVISESCTLGENDIVLGEWKYSMTPGTAYPIKRLPEFSDGNLEHQILAYRRELLQKIAYSQTEGIAYTDLEWIYKPMAAVSDFIYFPHKVYVYQQAREGQSVSPENHCRDIWMEQGVIMDLVRLYEKQKTGIREENRTVSKLVVGSFIQRMYYHYLIDYPGILPNDGLVKFDAGILGESPELYGSVAEASARVGRMKMRFVSEWRRHKNRRTLKFRYMDLRKAAHRLISR